MQKLTRDSRGIVINVGIVALIGIALIALAALGYMLHTSALWTYSYIFIGVGTLLLTAKIVGMNLWTIIILPISVMALWYFALMGGTI